MDRQSLGRTFKNALTGSMIAADILLVVLSWRNLEDGSAAPVIALSVAYTALAVVSARLPRGDVLHLGSGLLVAGMLFAGMWETILAASLGGVGAFLVSQRMRDDENLLLDLTRHPLLVLIVFSLWSAVIPEGVSPGNIGELVRFMLLAVTYVAADILTYSVIAAYMRGDGLLATIRSFARLTAGISMGLASIGIALALVQTSGSLVSDALSGAILVLLMLIMKHNFGLSLQIKSAYSRTVGVLSRLAEYEHPETRGHSERVADLATAIGRMLHISHKDLERLNLAALLHSVGQVGGYMKGSSAPPEHARAGAEIAARVGFLRDVAPIVELHHCSPVEAAESRDALLGHIVGVACRYDQLMVGFTALDATCSPLESIESQPDRYDPTVVSGLRALRRT